MRILVLNRVHRALVTRKGIIMPTRNTGKTAKVKVAKRETPRQAPKAIVVERATVLSSEVVYQGPLFRVQHDKTHRARRPRRTSAK